MKGTRTVAATAESTGKCLFKSRGAPPTRVSTGRRQFHGTVHNAPDMRAVAMDMGTTQQSKCEMAAVILPGLGRGSDDYRGLGECLVERGYEVEICFVRAVDWLRNAAGVTDGNYWRGTLNPRPTVDWYLKRIEEAVETVKQKTSGAPITLVGHSAGGWLARLYLKEFGTIGVENLITLGTPHKPPPKDKPGVFDQTRGILYFCEQEFPGNYHEDVNYITVAGKYVKGCEWNDDGSMAKKFAGAVYKQVCGEADVWGDGIVPNVSAHLDGATNIDLTDVFHGPITQEQDVSDTEETLGADRVWYGTKGITEKWLEHLDVVQNGNSLQ